MMPPTAAAALAAWSVAAIMVVMVSWFCFRCWSVIAPYWRAAGARQWGNSHRSFRLFFSLLTPGEPRPPGGVRKGKALPSAQIFASEEWPRRVYVRPSGGHLSKMAHSPF
jgi:hypothetical protein